MAPLHTLFTQTLKSVFLILSTHACVHVCRRSLLAYLTLLIIWTDDLGWHCCKVIWNCKQFENEYKTLSHGAFHQRSVQSHTVLIVCLLSYSPFGFSQFPFFTLSHTILFISMQCWYFAWFPTKHCPLMVSQGILNEDLTA